MYLMRCLQYRPRFPRSHSFEIQSVDVFAGGVLWWEVWEEEDMEQETKLEVGVYEIGKEFRKSE